MQSQRSGRLGRLIAGAGFVRPAAARLREALIFPGKGARLKGRFGFWLSGRPIRGSSTGFREAKGLRQSDKSAITKAARRPAHTETAEA